MVSRHSVIVYLPESTPGKKEATDGLSLHQFLQDQCIFLKVVSPKNGYMTNKFAIPGESTSFADHRA